MIITQQDSIVICTYAITDEIQKGSIALLKLHGLSMFYQEQIYLKKKHM